MGVLGSGFLPLVVRVISFWVQVSEFEVSAVGIKRVPFPELNQAKPQAPLSPNPRL